MEFVDLNRSFVPIKKDQEPNLDIGQTWGRRFGGWLDWQDLLEHRRVVLLAEASSGKTKEFRHQADTLARREKAAFFVRIEDLADEGLENALEPSAMEVFDRWRGDGTSEDGWFFLDSVDEARLHQKSLERALRCFARKLGDGLTRTHIYVSCRVSDWKIQEDPMVIERLLPIREKPVLPAPTNDDAALLDPIFKDPPRTRESASLKESECKLDELLVVQLVPLNATQQRALAVATGIEQPDAFVQEIERNGLDALAERPGDLLDLAGYWNDYGRFASLLEMTEHGIAAKLAEQNKFRPDNRDLPDEKARCGAERVAAALTLAKSFTLRAPGHEPDPTLAADALDPDLVLDDWTDAERNTLIRRGVFAPATYGRVRFHHRGTQEYLMARWLDRLLRAGCPRDTVWELVFAERYGIETLVPSLHATAAWLALEYPDIRDEIIRREPLVLLRHGDPGSLPLEAKERLLRAYADRHAAGEISDDRLDHRALWMFATPKLAGTIQQIWTNNDRDEFRIHLLGLIREAKIQACTDLARSVALDENGGDYLRTLALRALDACADAKGLATAARWLKGASSSVSARLGANFAKVLFPRHLSVAELLHLIERSPQPSNSAVEGFGYAIGDLWKACPDQETREHLLAGLADLCLKPPFQADYRRISMRHHQLASSLAPIGRDAVLALGNAAPSGGLVRLLMAIERAERHEPANQEGAPLTALVAGNTRLQRKLFWADVEEARQNAKRNRDCPTRFWQVRIYEGRLWQLGHKDLDWLFEDLSGHFLEADKQIALSAIVAILRDIGRLDAETLRLRKLVAGTEALQTDLDAYLSPPTEHEEERRLRLEEQRSQRVEDEKARKDKASWIRFRDVVKANPLVLCDPARLADWTGGAFRLENLTRWLRFKTGEDYREAALQWRLLQEGFGWTVATAYRDGMKTLWRVTLPERPKHEKSNRVVTKYTTLLSFAGLGIEAVEDPDWARRLSTDEARRAARHACLSEQGYPAWIESLVARHSTIVLPILNEALRQEWSGRHGERSDFFSHYSWTNQPIQPSIQQILFEIITGKKPKALDMLDRGLRVLQRLHLDDGQRRRVAALARRRLHANQTTDQDDHVQRYLAMLFQVDAASATHELVNWLDSTPSTLRSARAESALAVLFGQNTPLAFSALAGAPVSALEILVRLAYRHVRPEDDRRHESVYTPDARDRAEEARNNLLNALLDKPGPDVYRAIRMLAADRIFSERSIRLDELAHGKAEHDAEPPAWTPKELLDFERRHVIPAKTGEALLHVVMGVLSDIQSSFGQADATSRPLLERAKDEDEVQKWLAEQMDLRSKGRFHVHREAEVALADKPDIIVSSTAVQVEVAIEVKHGGMKWTVRNLEQALTKQLAEDYMKPATRRCGVLVVSHHGRRTWRDPDTNKKLEFQAVIKRLQTLAATVTRNACGPVEVRAYGIDASS